VLRVSFQDLSIGENEPRLKRISEFEWDLVIFDEVRYGHTERANNILSKLRISMRLYLSGTPFRLIEQDDFSAQQVYA